MRTRSRSVVLLACLGVAAAMLPWAAPGAAAANTITRVAGITMTAGSTTLVGAQTTTLTVRVHLVDPDGLPPTGCGAFDKGWGPGPCLMIESFTSGGAFYRASTQAVGGRLLLLRRVSGTDRDGVWAGTTRLGAIDAGIWRPVSITAGDLVAPDNPFADSFVDLPAALVRTTSVNLRGRDWPIVSLQLPVLGVPAGSTFTVRGKVVLLVSRRAVPGLRILVANLCSPFDYLTVRSARTGVAGTFAVRSSVVDRDWCALWGTDAVGTPIGFKAVTKVFVRATVTSHASATSVRAGSTVVVTGRTAPTSVLVALQRYQSGRWTQVAAGGSDAAGGYRMTTRPGHGTWRYRVRVPGGIGFAGTIGSTFTLTGR